MGFSRQEYWSGWPFPSPVDHILSDLSTMTRPSWMAPHGMAECRWVRQDCGPVIRLACCLWLWFQSVCPLTPSLSAYRLTWFLLPWTQGLSSRLLQKSAAAPPYLGRGVAPPGCAPVPLQPGCESWTIKKAEHRRTDAFGLWCWRSWEPLGLQQDPTRPS